MLRYVKAILHGLLRSKSFAPLPPLPTASPRSGLDLVAFFILLALIERPRYSKLGTTKSMHCDMKRETWRYTFFGY